MPVEVVGEHHRVETVLQWARPLLRLRRAGQLRPCRCGRPRRRRRTYAARCPVSRSHTATTSIPVLRHHTAG
ncbi:hypothetical protein [Streptomyces fradiae]|uniref:hypothetical protein n=1 Tax=Streptomyces fradiae TaxID=1906 RepID=UPI003655F919